MKWEGRAGSDNVEDRRGQGGRRIGLPMGGGIGGIVLLLLISALTGQNPIDLIGTLGGDAGVGIDESPGSNEASVSPANDPQSQFIRVMLKDTEDAWGEIFARQQATYEPPVLVLFTQATQSGCGLGESAMGPFYCPADRKVYLDLSFFRELDQRFGAPGDFA